MSWNERMINRDRRCCVYDDSIQVFSIKRWWPHWSCIETAVVLSSHYSDWCSVDLRSGHLLERKSKDPLSLLRCEGHTDSLCLAACSAPHPWSSPSVCERWTWTVNNAAVIPYIVLTSCRPCWMCTVVSMSTSSCHSSLGPEGRGRVGQPVVKETQTNNVTHIRLARQACNSLAVASGRVLTVMYVGMS